MTLQQRLDYLQGLRQRAAAMLLPATAERVVAALDQMKAGTTQDSEKQIFDLIHRSREGDRQAQSALAELRVFTVDNFVTASSNPMSFFEEIALKDDEEPWIENTSKQEITVSYIGNDGKPKKTAPFRFQETKRIDLFTISSDEYEYVTMDIYKGQVKTPALANVDISRDVMFKIDAKLWPYIKGSVIDNFNLTGRKSGRVYVPHSFVNVKNLPTTNKLVIDGNTTTTEWRKECMDAVIKYITRWGSNAFADGEFSKTIKVTVPSLHATGFLNQIQLTSFPNSKVEEVFATGGLRMTYAGYTWIIVPDNTLDPDDRMAYVNLGKPIGYFFTKKGMDRTKVINTDELDAQNKEATSMKKVIGFGLPQNWCVNLVGVEYQAAE